MPHEDTFISQFEQNLFLESVTYKKQMELKRKEDELNEDEEGEDHSVASFGHLMGKLRELPYREILKSMPLWAIFIAMFARLWVWILGVSYNFKYIQSLYPSADIEMVICITLFPFLQFFLFYKKSI